ncbi:MAG: BlaI/MecI/CopY family transcriptional regulator [Alistipes sp.]
MNATTSKPIKLTHGEEEVMQILWLLEKGFVNDLIAQMDDPKPKYTTVSTFIKILENKGFVEHESFGKSHLYYPLIQKEEYAQSQMNNMLSDYFNGSLSQLVSCFSQQENISVQEMDEILKIMRKTQK